MLVFLLLFAGVHSAEERKPLAQQKEDKPALQLETFYLAIMNRVEPFDSDKAARLAEREQKY